MDEMMKKSLIIAYLFISILTVIHAQEKKVWNLEECINYALEQNLDIRKSELSNDVNSVNILQNKASLLPSLDGSVRQSFDWMNQTDNISGEEEFTGSNGTSYSIGSNITLFNGLKLKNNIEKAEISYEQGVYDSEVIRESIAVSVLEAYLNVLYLKEQVNNSTRQLESTREQLRLAGERLNLGSISQSDYLQVKSQLSAEELTLANANSQLEMSKVSLMQLMELPVNNDFEISVPELDKYTLMELDPDPQDVFNIALQIKPQVKSAELGVTSSELDVEIAKAAYIPRVSLDAGLSTSYRSGYESDQYGLQLQNNINPSVGISISIPIFSNRQAKSQVEIARLGIQTAELEQMNTNNQLRKAIEQVCVDVNSSETEYLASYQQYLSTMESFDVATEKYRQGMMNSVDYLFEKTNLIVAESELLQSKYNMIYSYKMLDYYKGIQFTL